MTPSRGPIASFFTGLWDVMNFTRRLIMNFLFFGLLFLLLMFVLAAIAGGRARPVLDRSTLVIAPDGLLVEQFTSDPFTRSLSRALGDGRDEVQLRDLLRALESARTDKKIERVFLHMDGLQANGFASLREVAAAIARLRESGKQVVAFSEQMDQKQYLLAAQANEVYLDPMGMLLLEGLGRYRQYFREGLEDKLGVDVHLFKVGEYKSAAEPYVLDAASPESKEADLYWMNDVWQRYVTDVAKARRIAPAQLSASIRTLPAAVEAAQGDLAALALRQKLVDGLKTREQVDALLAERGLADDDAEGGYRHVTLDGYLAHLDEGLAPAVGDAVAVVVAEGEITGGDQPPGTIGGDSTAALLRDAREDRHVKAVVLRVNSPGGEVFASEQIRREVEALKREGTPVVVSMGDVAASGGYWISMNADRIYADPSTITGSIGIFGLFPTIPRTLDKLGINTDGVGTTPLAGAFDITRPLDPQVGTVIQSVIEKGYRDFTGRVAQARGRSVEQVDAVARGRVWSGEQAMQRGLVDAMGGLQVAIDDATRRAELDPKRVRVRYVEKTSTPFERFFGGVAESRVGALLLRDSDLARTLIARVAPQAARDLRFIEQAIGDRRGAPVKSIAYCFCGL